MTDCVGRYNRKIESISEDRSIRPFAHLWWYVCYIMQSRLFYVSSSKKFNFWWDLVQRHTEGPISTDVTEHFCISSDGSKIFLWLHTWFLTNLQQQNLSGKHSSFSNNEKYFIFYCLMIATILQCKSQFPWENRYQTRWILWTFRNLYDDDNLLYHLHSVDNTVIVTITLSTNPILFWLITIDKMISILAK